MYNPTQVKVTESTKKGALNLADIYVPTSRNVKLIRHYRLEKVFVSVARMLGVQLFTFDTIATATNRAKIQGYQKAYQDTLTEFNKFEAIVKAKPSKKKGKK